LETRLVTSQPLPTPSRRSRRCASAIVPIVLAGGLAPAAAHAAIIPPPGPWPTNVTGATNPLIGTPFQFNRDQASSNAQMRVWLPSRGRRRTAVTRIVGQTTVVRGQLRNLDNRRAIAGATLTLAVQNVYTPEWVASGNVRTNRRGDFRAVLPAGYHRRVGVLYYAAINTASPLFSRRLLIRAKSRVDLARPYHKRGSRKYRFGGQVSAGAVAVPSSGLLIAFQVRNRRGNWITARLARTTASGRFRIRYTFPTFGALRVRVRVPSQTGWALYAGASRVRYVSPRR
jgi:hypothetical protein